MVEVVRSTCRGKLCPGAGDCLYDADSSMEGGRGEGVSLDDGGFERPKKPRRPERAEGSTGHELVSADDLDRASGFEDDILLWQGRGTVYVYVCDRRLEESDLESDSGSDLGRLWTSGERARLCSDSLKGQVTGREELGCSQVEATMFRIGTRSR